MILYNRARLEKCKHIRNFQILNNYHRVFFADDGWWLRFYWIAKKRSPKRSFDYSVNLPIPDCWARRLISSQDFLSCNNTFIKKTFINKNNPTDIANNRSIIVSLNMICYLLLDNSRKFLSRLSLSFIHLERKLNKLCDCGCRIL